MYRFGFVIASLMAFCIARSWAQPLPPCKTPAVYQEIAKLQVDAKTAEDISKRAEYTYRADYDRLQQCNAENERPSNWKKSDCNPFLRALQSSTAAMEKAAQNWQRILDRLEALYALPNCPEPATPPPPPPRPEPQPPVSQPQPGGLHPPGVTATHRETACPRCQPIAAKLNQAADNYALAVNRHDPDQTMFRQQMSEYSGELDQCERQCNAPPNNPVMTVPEPRLQQPQRSPDSGQPLFDWGPYTVPNRPGSVLPQRPTENGPAPR